MDENEMRRQIRPVHRTEEEQALVAVWRLLADGMSLAEVARRLGLSADDVLVRTRGDPAIQRVLAALSLLTADEIRAALLLFRESVANRDTQPE